MGDVKWMRTRRWQRFAGIPDVLAAALGKQLAVEVKDLVDAMKRAAPVSDDLEDTPGQFRDSIHAYTNPSMPLSYRVIADARDPETGNFIGPHIEHGHMSVNGEHVPAKPSFFPTWRARRTAMRRRLSAAGRKAIKQHYPG